MARLALVLLLRLILLVFVSTFLLFLVMYLAPGGRFKGNPVSVYFEWIHRLFTSDLEIGQPIMTQLMGASLITISVSLIATFMLVGLVWSMSWMALLGTRKRLAGIISAVLYSISCLPAISMALIAIVMFIALTGKLPYVSELGGLPFGLKLVTLALPVAVLALGDGKFGNGVRFLREELHRVASEPFMVAVKARGGEPSRHIRRNVAPALVSLTVSSATSILGWTFVVEYLFGLKGLGYMLVISYNLGHHHIVLAITGISALLVLLINVFGRLTVAANDPRLRGGF